MKLFLYFNSQMDFYYREKGNEWIWSMCWRRILVGLSLYIGKKKVGVRFSRFKLIKYEFNKKSNLCINSLKIIWSKFDYWARVRLITFKRKKTLVARHATWAHNLYWNWEFDEGGVSRREGFGIEQVDYGKLYISCHFLHWITKNSVRRFGIPLKRKP